MRTSQGTEKEKSMTWLISDLRFSQTEGRTTSYKGRFPKAEVT